MYIAGGLNGGKTDPFAKAKCSPSALNRGVFKIQHLIRNIIPYTSRHTSDNV